MNKLQRVIALAKEAGGGRRLVGGDWIFTEQQLVAFFDAASATIQPSASLDPHQMVCPSCGQPSGKGMDMFAYMAELITKHPTAKGMLDLAMARATIPTPSAQPSVCLRCHGTGTIDAATSVDDPSCPDCEGEGVKP